MTPSTPATNHQGGRTLNVETTGTAPNTVLFQDTSTAPNQPFAKSFSLDPTQVKEARERVKSHLSDEGIWKIIESQPAPLRDIIIWFCDQMNLAHLGHKRREHALRKYTDIKDGNFYIARSINLNVSLNKSSNLAESKEAEAEILGFANTLDIFQRGASQHMHGKARANGREKEDCRNMCWSQSPTHRETCRLHYQHNRTYPQQKLTDDG